jgi:hypothetical protein
MSLPALDGQPRLFCTAALRPDFFGPFGPTDRYRFFAQKIYPLLVRACASLSKAYCPDNGRAVVEPVLLLGVSRFQYLDGAPDRRSLALLHTHAGWNFAFSRTLGDKLFHPTVLTCFRNRLIEHERVRLVFQQALDGLVEAGSDRAPQPRTRPTCGAWSPI